MDKEFGWSPRLKVSDIIKTPESLFLKFNQNNNVNESWITNNVNEVNEDQFENEKNALIMNNSSNSLFN